jgi:excisionase family DNA binding protein
MSTQHLSQTSKKTFFTPAELENRWTVSQMTLRRWRAAGRLKALKFGRGVRFALDDVLEFEEQARC